MPGLQFAGHDFEVVGGTALFWPAQNALIFADLHLEKASWFATRGQMLPPQESLATLERIADLVATKKPAQIWCLGDSFHDEEGPNRLLSEARTLLARLTDETDWHWIIGNHDEKLPDGIGGYIHDEAELGGVILRHKAVRGDPRAEMSGHFHPKYRATANGRSVPRACFVATATKLIFPAFGALTGGLDARHPEIAVATGTGAKALVATKNTLLTFPL